MGDEQNTANAEAKAGAPAEGSLTELIQEKNEQLDQKESRIKGLEGEIAALSRELEETRRMLSVSESNELELHRELHAYKSKTIEIQQQQIRIFQSQLEEARD